MKKILITGVALFTFLIFSGLGLVVLFSNSFGVNIDNSSLFPQVEVTTLDEETTDKLSGLTDFYNTENDSSVTIVNKSGKDITIEYTNTSYSKVEGTPNYYIDGNGVYLTTEGNKVILNAIPETYDYYLSNGNEFSPYDVPNVYARVEEYYDSASYYDYVDSEQVTTDTINLKDGESYEIKLPE